MVGQSSDAPKYFQVDPSSVAGLSTSRDFCYDGARFFTCTTHCALQEGDNFQPLLKTNKNEGRMGGSHKTFVGGGRF